MNHVNKAMIAWVRYFVVEMPKTGLISSHIYDLSIWLN